MGVNSTPLSQAAAAKPSGLWMASYRDYVLPFASSLEGRARRDSQISRRALHALCSHCIPPQAYRGRNKPTTVGSGNLVQNQAGNGYGGPRRMQLTGRGLHPSTSSVLPQTASPGCSGRLLEWAHSWSRPALCQHAQGPAVSTGRSCQGKWILGGSLAEQGTRH